MARMLKKFARVHYRRWPSPIEGPSRERPNQLSTWDLPVCMVQAGQQCDAYFVTPEPGAAEQLLIIGERSMPALFATDAHGHWQLLGQIQISATCKQQLREAAEQGKLQWQAPLQRDLLLNGVRLRTQGMTEKYQDCPQEKK